MKKKSFLKIYLGAPLFSEQEQFWNIHVENKIKDKFGDKVRIYNPCNNDEINDKSGYADSLAIYHADNEHLDKSDVMIALLDGVALDAGLSSEIGRFAHIAENSKDKYILGVYSDVRQGNVSEEKVVALNDLAESQWSYLNLYTVGAIKNNGMIYSGIDEMIEDLEKLMGELLND